MQYNADKPIGNIDIAMKRSIRGLAGLREPGKGVTPVPFGTPNSSQSMCCERQSSSIRIAHVKRLECG